LGGRDIGVRGQGPGVRDQGIGNRDSNYYSERKSSSIHPHPSPPPSRGREFKEGITFLLRVIALAALINNESCRHISTLNFELF
jgi:hypothetical protein